MNRGIRVGLVLGAVALLCTGVAAAETSVVLETTDDAFLESLLSIFTDFFDSLRSLLDLDMS